MAIIKRIIGLTLLLSLAAVFILSGLSKLQSIELFAGTFLNFLPVSFDTASIIANLFIGLEWLLGLMLAAHLFLRRFTYKASLALLLLLTAYLVWLIIQQGNTGNCGCFGEWLEMTPGAAIWKNVAMIAAVVVLHFIYPSRPYRYQWYVAFGFAVAAFTAPFVVEPVHMHSVGKVVKEPINLQPLYTYGTPPPANDLTQGKHIICYFSTTCPHCVKGAYLVQLLHRRYPKLPLFMALNGTEILQKSFLEESLAASVPHTLLSNTPAFSSMAGQYVPAIYWVDSSVIVRKVHYTELEPGEINAWLRK